LKGETPLASWHKWLALICSLILAESQTLAPSVAQSGVPFQVVEPWQTVLIEHQDREHRLRRLADIQGIPAPEFYEYMIPKEKHGLADYPVDIPVLRVVFKDQVFFDFDKDELKPEGFEVLNVIAASLRLEPPDVTVFIAGHTDAIGSVDYNLDLGLRRARNAATALAMIGVNRSQIYLVSFGKAVPIASNDTEEGRARNRRVEFLFAARPEPIAAWLAEQPMITCAADNSRKGDNCPVDFHFKAVSVSLIVPKQDISVGQNPKDISVKSQDPTVNIGTKVIDIDLKNKVFTMAAPE
jgi:OmpA-OmpF porin, OOP family